MRYVTREEMRSIDQAATQRFGIPSLLLMENAGSAAAGIAAQQIPHLKTKNPKVLCLCGPGNNGGDAMVVTRHLFNRGFDVGYYLSASPKKNSYETALNLDILIKMGIRRIQHHEDLKALRLAIMESDFIVDGLFGIGLSRNLDTLNLEIIQAVNESKKQVLSLDIPSGMDSDTGHELPECIKAKWTVTFGLPKKAFSSMNTSLKVGELFMVDIGLPRALLHSPSIA